MKNLLKYSVLGFCVASLLMGGTCERYKKKMETRDRMKHYYDSVLKAERIQKEKQWEKQMQERKKEEQK